ncbi:MULTISPECIES: hypothetical protein [Rhodopseudomonas]|uniref:Phage protein n=1 Tax=Rhodopseudomonas palustris TaxID=1076 RepID=A0A0D7EER4_RHOPL|nr:MULTISPECIES: hypothetical protein [Rhodopseudomonas]KIZ38067.1 hypothetical protein OO17_23145 [Rhodopseudomonas palustris]MDF3810544.1 hypothetical protein [Rhodopseudomonas sp. BAL398]WOK18396.1 hypothetical protein RBJ75_02365 [Rhodopseudomonas sp. BAL398]
MTATTHEIKLGDKVIALEVTAKAAARVSSYFGGFVPAHNAVREIDLFAYRRIIAVGLDQPLTDDDGLEAAIFAAGPIDIQGSVLKYLDLLVTGGRGSQPADQK